MHIGKQKTVTTFCHRFVLSVFSDLPELNKHKKTIPGWHEKHYLKTTKNNYQKNDPLPTAQRGFPFQVPFSQGFYKVFL